MSGSGISKTAGVVGAAATDVAETRDRLDGDLSTLRRRLDELAGQWEGRGQRAFLEAIGAWQASADRVIRSLDDFELQLRATESTYDDADEQVASGLAGLSGRAG